MKIHREAYPTVFYAAVTFVLINLGMWQLFRDQPHIYQSFFYTTLLILLLIIYFFRVPSSIPPVNEQEIISPAYGKVVEIIDEFEGKFFQDTRKRLSIFMSPLDIHCNYVPTSGMVEFAEHFPGKYLVAYHPKSSELNEHTFTVINHNGYKLGVKQIAGFMARRIVPYMREGITVEQNDELGFIKFGSRVDVFFPVDVQLSVSIGDKVQGGITVLAELQ